MRLSLREASRTEAIVRLEAVIPPSPSDFLLQYETRTGALARVDGAIVGAFDREHSEITIVRSETERTLTLEVERFALPTNGLPSGDGITWRMMIARAHAEPSFEAILRPFEAPLRGAPQGDTVLWGHSHLDVAWLWNYTETKRKAMRTFANALALVERNPSFVYMQSQPQLYAFIEETDPAFFGRVQAAVRAGRFSAEPAAMWVEPDCNVISGESLLRQMLYAHEYCVARFGIEPSLVWLPDTFGFANTLPTVIAHAGIQRFATTKLQWNDTTRFPYAQFVWRGPDGSDVTAAMIAAYEGDATPHRVQLASKRGEPLIVGYSDGGGGPTQAQLDQAAAVGTWETPSQWFERLATRTDLPLHRDELYLEYHRGTYTTHHDMKASNAEFERELADAEERLAWCIAVGASKDVLERLLALMHAAWRIVLCNQFHDVLPGTSVQSAHEEARETYAQAREALQLIRTSTSAMLPRAPNFEARSIPVGPVEDDGDFVFDNGIVHARVSAKGALLELRGDGIASVVAQANLLALYRDKPKKWDAWNLDDGYEKKRLKLRPRETRAHDDHLEVRFDAAGSPITTRIRLNQGEPFLRVDASIDWRAEHAILRMENWLSVQSDSVTYGSPHGTIERSIGRDTPEQKAKFEVPGQRFATAGDARASITIFTKDTYGWSARPLQKGGMQLGHSLLRATRWPDPQADIGMHEISWAFAPHSGASPGAIELAWEQFARGPRVRLFLSASTQVLVVAVKPALDGDGVIVRARECDGRDATLRLRCGARMRSVERVDGLERPLGGDAAIEGEELVATIKASGLASFRVRF